MTQTERHPIRLLPDALVNKIAAGEVVERPASVVKELLDNAVDAGATRLTVAIEDGGRTLIRVTDDGCGIPPEEAALAFTQHATSKIRTPEDLFAIVTMGFRGEALASIASVSHAALITRTAESPQAVRLEVKDSVIGAPVPCAAPVGTTIEVRDLFYSVPARRKFLRADATEFGHIHEMVLRTALPHPHIAITLTHNGRSVLELPATADPRQRIAAALAGGAAAAREFYEQLLPIAFSERGVTVQGAAGQPSLARATAKYQYIFLNGRFIRDRSLLHALKEAYRGLIEPASQPVAVLFVTMDPMSFDVNVHPQKIEVRFRDPNVAYSRLLAAVREKLLATDLTPGVRTAGRTDGADGGADRGADGGPPKTTAESAGGTAGPESSAETRRIIADFFKSVPAPQPRLGFDEAAPATPATPTTPAAPALPPLGSGSWPAARTVDDLAIVQKLAAQATGLAAAADSAAASASAAAPRANGAAVAGAPPVPSVSGGGTAAGGHKFIQLHNSYLVAQTADGLVIIDQHALHERILYEELFARVTRGPLEGQRLLLPEVLPVNPRQQAVLESVRPLLADLGIEVSPFDAQSVAVHTFPSLLAKVSPREFLRDLLDKLLELGSRLTREELLHEVLDMASCKAAVKAGYPLSAEEIAALLARKDQVERSSNCPHGRPTTLRLTLGDLERQFKRK